MLNSIFRYVGGHRIRFTYLLLLAIVFGGLGSWRVFGQQTSPPATSDSTTVEHRAASTFTYFSFLSDPQFSTGERVALFAALAVAIAALLYAWMLVRQVRDADQGTPKMREIASAIREGANAYLARQLKVVASLIIVLVLALFLSKFIAAGADSIHYALGRAWAFLMGAVFSATVGFVGMRMATTGNLRVAAAAPVGFGRALMLGYRSGTITGMLTDGLGLLGGTIIFMMYGEHAYEALLGFGFGGTLLALFMRVGGGIYTKAADVGADLVG
jgi:K(+)-stimulated pyrophosphate-energized sodium pump